MQPDPGQAGPFRFDTFVYASSALNYGGVPALNQYVVYGAPSPGFTTPRINLSAFANLGSAPWPFTIANVPLNGHVCVPRGRGPFPLALFVHGNHNPLENSTPGYLYLCELLASHGIIAATIDANFLNGFNSGENDARGIVHLEHARQFRAWNHTPGHRLAGQVDLSRVALIGHSRGGEGAGHASLFNRLSSVQPDLFSPVVPLDGTAGLGPYGFGIRAVVAIAPTDRQYQPIAGPTVVPDAYFLIHGSRDQDVSNFGGYNTYNRAHAVSVANPGVSSGQPKSLLWVYGANHNHFNSVWQAEGPAVAITRAEQETVAKVFIGAVAQARLLERSEYLELLSDHAAATSMMPAGINLVSQFQHPQRCYLQHEQEGLGAPQVSLPTQGAVNLDAVVAARQFRDLVNAGGPITWVTLRLQWGAAGARMQLQMNPTTVPAERYGVLALRIGQSAEAGNAVQRDQDFSIEISSGSRTWSVAASAAHRLLYPDNFGAAKIVMQSLRIPLAELRSYGIEPADIRSVALVFDKRSTGVVYVGDIQLSH